MSRRHAFETLDVFAHRRFSGNPLAVVHDAEGLSDAEMQTIAAMGRPTHLTVRTWRDGDNTHAEIAGDREPVMQGDIQI